jgi:hypothetical protein
LKIRWKNTLVKPNSDSEIQLFMAKYPGLFLIPSAILSGYGYYFWEILTELEEGKRVSVLLGKLKIMYDIFGKWGLVSFFILIAFGFAHVFWVYAIRVPKSLKK